MLRALDDGFWQVQKEAIIALGRLRSAAAVPALIEATRSSDIADLRRSAASAAGELAAREALAPCAAWPNDPDIEVKKAAARAQSAIESAIASPPTAQ